MDIKNIKKKPMLHKLVQYWPYANGYTPVNRQINVFIITAPVEKVHFLIFELVSPPSVTKISNYTNILFIKPHVYSWLYFWRPKKHEKTQF